MKIIYNSWIFRVWPMKNYAAMVLGRWMLTGYKKGELPRRVLRHELVHQAQMDRHGIFMFYVIYLKDYFVNLVRYRSHDEAYRRIPFEIEAYSKE